MADRTLEAQRLQNEVLALGLAAVICLAVPASVAATAKATPAAGRDYDPSQDVEATRDYDPSQDVEAATRFIEALEDRRPAQVDGAGTLPRIALYGDSTALAMNVGLQYWLDRHGRAEPVLGAAEFGCGLLREGQFRFQGRVRERPESCRDRDVAWREALRRDRPDLAVVSFGTWEVCDRRFAGDPTWRRIGEPAVDERIREEMRSVVDLLAAAGAHVVWLTHPRIAVRDPTTGEPPAEPYPESDPARMERFNDLVRELPEARPGKVEVLDLAAHFRSLPGGELDTRYRPDGIHLSAAGTLRLAHGWLEERVLRIVRERAGRPAMAASPSGEP